MDMGRTARGGPSHKIKAYGAQFWSTCTARQSEDILVMKEDLFGYDRYRIPCKYLPYNRIDLGLNRLITLSLDYIRWVGTPSNSSHIQYNPPTTHDVGYYVDQMACIYLNRLSLRLCHHPAPIMHTSTNSSTTVGIPLGRQVTRFCRQWHTT